MFTLILAMAARPVIGGQAVIEGVMMRSPHSFAVAVRRPDDTIVVREQQWLSFSQRFKFLRWPLLRGATMLVESMYNGMNALNFSASQALEEEETNEEGKDGKDGSTSRLGLMLTVALSIGGAFLIFKGVPHGLTTLIGELGARGGETILPVTGWQFHLVDGGLRLLVFVSYILLISRMPDVKRLFMYHGAEHKSVHTWEAELPLDVKHTKPQSTAHPRCGTSLILLVITVSVFVFAAIIPFLPVVSENSILQSLFTLVVKLPLLLPVAGLAYEVQRMAAKHPENALVRGLIAPGMLMQRLTTREPTDRELEVALTALRKTVWRERLATGEAQPLEAVPAPQADEPILEIYKDFEDVQERVAA